FRGVIEGKFLKILSHRRESDKVVIVYQKKGNIYGYFPRDEIMIDFFDDNGSPVSGDKNTTPDRLRHNEIRTTNFLLPKGTKSYRIWLIE
ncbi:MAG: hypothetical protein U1C55_02780, partial [Smithellaceae bacterium]|nr:hypothetical protein [Smithellaceae bacterium]